MDEAYLTAEIARLHRLNESLISRMAAMCEVLGRKANRLPVACPHCGGAIDFIGHVGDASESREQN